MCERWSRTCDVDGCPTVVAEIVRSGNLCLINSMPIRAPLKPHEFRCLAHRHPHQRFPREFYAVSEQRDSRWVFRLLRHTERGLELAYERSAPIDSYLLICEAVEELDALASLSRHRIIGDETWARYLRAARALAEQPVAQIDGPTAQGLCKGSWRPASAPASLVGASLPRRWASVAR